MTTETATERFVKARARCSYLGCLVALALVAVAAVTLAGCSDTGTNGRSSEVIRLEDELADTQTSLEDAQSEIEDLEDENDELQSQLHDANAPFETTEDDAYLDESEWQQGLVAAQDLLGKGTIRRGYFGVFAEAVGEQEGVYWSPIEEAQFQSRYRAWYREKYGY